jgi:hypothetical protein
MKNRNKEGEIVRLESQGLQQLESDPTFRESFQRVGCLYFCEKLQGYHMEVAKEFSLNFNGVQKKKLDHWNFKFQKTPSHQPLEYL